jgi:hypothetical protein
MSDLTPELRAEIAKHLRESSGIRLGMVVRDMERGFTVEQIASSQGIPLNGARGYVRGVDAMLNGELPTAPSSALKTARTYRYLLGCNLSPALRSYVKSGLRQLAAINPEIPVDEPFRPGTLGGSDTHARPPTTRRRRLRARHATWSMRANASKGTPSLRSASQKRHSRQLSGSWHSRGE